LSNSKPDWRNRRILILFSIFFLLAGNKFLTERDLRDWKEPLVVRVYPFNGDDLETTQEYIESLQEDDYISIASFIDEEAKAFGLEADGLMEIELSDESISRPPELPEQRSFWNNISWSLKFRFWANWELFKHEASSPDIALFLLYFDPEEKDTLSHSVGLKGSQSAYINVFAEKKYHRKNLVVVTHEMLHILGAGDKYDIATNYPFYPVGFAEPDASPLLPQTYAEIMAGRIPVDNLQAKIPDSLSSVLIGEQTAMEINWF
jgi:hypothetical protein